MFSVQCTDTVSWASGLQTPVAQIPTVHDLAWITGLLNRNWIVIILLWCWLSTLGGSQWVHCGSSRRYRRKWSGRLRRRIFRGNGSAIWIHTRSVSWSGCQRSAKRSTSTFTSCRSYTCQSMFSQSRGQHCEWSWPSRQTFSGTTKFTDSPRSVTVCLTTCSPVCCCTYFRLLMPCFSRRRLVSLNLVFWTIDWHLCSCFSTKFIWSNLLTCQ